MPSRRTPRTGRARWSPRRSRAIGMVRINPPRTDGAPPTSTPSRRLPRRSGSLRPSPPTTCCGSPPAPLGLPLDPRDRDARGVLAAPEIASVPGVPHLSIGGLDLRRDLDAGDGALQMLYARSHSSWSPAQPASPPPVDSVYPRLDDDPGLRAEAEFVRSLGFGRSPPSIHGSSRSSTRRSRHLRTNWPGRAGARGVRGRRPRRDQAARTANSSTSRSPHRAQRLLEIAGLQHRQDPLGA